MSSLSSLCKSLASCFVVSRLWTVSFACSLFHQYQNIALLPRLMFWFIWSLVPALFVLFYLSHLCFGTALLPSLPYNSFWQVGIILSVFWMVVMILFFNQIFAENIVTINQELTLNHRIKSSASQLSAALPESSIHRSAKRYL